MPKNDIKIYISAIQMIVGTIALFGSDLNICFITKTTIPTKFLP